ncbi:unnamed protein product, partial [Hapterophycus canaliculatus]
WRTLKDKFQPNDQQHRRELITDLNSITMKEGADPDRVITDVWDLANKLECIGEGVTEARLAHIVLEGLPPSYDPLRLQADMDAGFTLSKIERTARNMYKSRSRSQQQQRRHQRDSHERKSGMVAFSSKPHEFSRIVCHGCGGSGQMKRNCPNRRGDAGSSSS